MAITDTDGGGEEEEQEGEDGMGRTFPLHIDGEGESGAGRSDMESMPRRPVWGTDTRTMGRRCSRPRCRCRLR